MKKLIATLATIAIAFTMTTGALADEKKDAKKEATVKGKAVCAHCNLSLGDSCATVIQTTKKDKDGKEIKQVYWLTDNDVAKKLGKGAGQEVIAKGTVKKEGKKDDVKLLLTATSIVEK